MNMHTGCMSLSPAFLTRRSHTARPVLTVLNEFSLTRGRVHELCGLARRSLALLVARQTNGPVVWIAPGWLPDQLNPDAVQDWINPGRLVFLRIRRSEDLLWAMEEVLRAGVVELVVTELPESAALTPVRRLHLAAERGAESSDLPTPLGLILSPGTGGSAGVESRWQLKPKHRPGKTAWQIARLRARNGGPKTWTIQGGSPGSNLAASSALEMRSIAQSAPHTKS